jgi:CTP synthase (UTP-ammonia lyase)
MRWWNSLATWQGSETQGDAEAPGTRKNWLSEGSPASLVEQERQVTAVAGVEAIELPDHPFFLATLFQPQVGSLAGRPLHPVIQAFLAASANLSVQ